MEGGGGPLNSSATHNHEQHAALQPESPPPFCTPLTVSTRRNGGHLHYTTSFTPVKGQLRFQHSCNYTHTFVFT
jgi:hypothetical protein